MSSTTSDNSQITLDKSNCIKLLKTLAEKGQDAGHYPLQLSHMIFQAFLKIEQIEKEAQDGNKDATSSNITQIEDNSNPDEMTELKAFQIIIEAVLKSQSLGHAYTLVDASNLFLIVLYINENVLKKLDSDNKKGKQTVK